MRWRVALSVCAVAVLGVQPVAAQADPAGRPVAGQSAGARSVNPRAVDEGATFVPVAPRRVLDTRDGTGGAAGPIQSRLTLDLSAHVPASATAVVFNLTGTEPTAATYVKIAAAQHDQPANSSLNLGVGETRANLVTVALPAGQRLLHLYNNAGTVHLIADVAGYYTTDDASRFTTTPPTRVLDTRTTTALGPRASREVDLSAHVPASATSVTFTLTGTEPTATTHVIAHPSGATRPVVSNLNLVPGQTGSNLVTVALGTDRRISLYNNAGATHLVVDLAGYYAGDRGHRFFPVSPIRAADTREAGGPLGAGQTRVVDLGTRIPLSSVAAVVNLTGTNVTAATHVTAYRSGTTRPTASNLNLSPGQDTANGAVVAIGGDARMALYNNAGSTDLVVDLAGFFATPPPCTADCVHGWGGHLRYGSTPSRRPWLSGITDVAAGQGVAYALKSDGTVLAWGDNEAGALGTGVFGGTSTVPLPVTGLTGVTAIAAAGDGTGYALRSDGTVWAWGEGEYGQLGQDWYGLDSNVPVPVRGLTGVTAIAAISATGYALKSDGTVWAWGDSSLGALGDGTCPPDPHCGSGTPVRVALPRPEGTAFIAIAAAGMGRTAYALRSDGTAWAWGRNYDGESGTGVPHTGKVSPTPVADLTDVVTIGGGLEVGYAATADGRVWAWGTDYWGALGTGTVCADPGTRCRQAVPVRVSGLTGAVAIEGAHGTAFAVQADGSVWAWGRNSVTGDLGNGTTGVCDGIPLSDECRSTVPVRTAIAGVSAVAAGGLGHFAVVRG